MRVRDGAGGRCRLLASRTASRRRKSASARQGWSVVELHPALVALLVLAGELGFSAGDWERPARHREERRWDGASWPLTEQWRVGSLDHEGRPLSPQQWQLGEKRPQAPTAVQKQVRPRPVASRLRARRSAGISGAGGRSSKAVARTHTGAELSRQEEAEALPGREREGAYGGGGSTVHMEEALLGKRSTTQRATGPLRQKGEGEVGSGRTGGQRLSRRTRRQQSAVRVAMSKGASEEGRRETYSEDSSSSVASAAILGPTRSHKFDLTDFGAKGDGTSDNTRAFQNAMYALSSVADKGGGQLFIPPGRYLTGCFNLTSSMTLFLAKGAVIMANPDVSLWPVVPPLPSYGRGREMPGPRFSSFIYGQNLTDVIITGDGGVVDGMGSVWWERARAKQLKYSRGPLMQFLWSTDVIVANITLVNSSYWALHPVYSRNITLGHLKILAPDDSPNTGGIFPDSCQGVLIEAVQIRTGGDCVDIKSGWDEYGMQYNVSSSGVVVRGCHLQCVQCSALSIGSEMSGGVHDILYEDVVILESMAGFRLKTSPGRGGYVRGIALRNIVMEKVGVAISFLPMYGQHADDRYDPTALPVVANFTFENVTGCKISKAGILEGLPTAPFRQIHITHVHLDLVEGGQGFSCRDVNGTAKDVIPTICKELAPSIQKPGDATGSAHAED